MSGQQHTPAALYPPGKTWYPLCRRLGGPQGWSGWAENLAPTGIRSPDRPACSQLLYQLSYPAHRTYATTFLHFVALYYNPLLASISLHSPLQEHPCNSLLNQIHFPCHPNSRKKKHKIQITTISQIMSKTLFHTFEHKCLSKCKIRCTRIPNFKLHSVKAEVR